jgi:hypothetical protein
MAGVEMLPPEAGVAWIRRELTAHAFRGEVVAAGDLGRMAAGYHPTGGLDTAAVDVAGSGLVGEVVAADVIDGLVVRTTLDPTAQPFLDDHRIDGTPVLPGVMGMEMFAEAARLLVPGWFVTALEDVDFRSPVKFYRDAPRTLTVIVRLRPEGAELVADCRLEGERLLPGTDAPQRTVHFTGSVRLSDHRPEPEPAAPPGDPRMSDAGQGTVLSPGDVYRLYFHGPAFQVVAQAWRQDGAAAARMAEQLPPDRAPATPATVLGPRLEELCFQVAGLWEAGHEGRLALPAHIDRLTMVGDVADAENRRPIAIARPRNAGVYDCEVLDHDGKVLLRMQGYGTVPMPVPVADDVRAPLREALTERG